MASAHLVWWLGVGLPVNLLECGWSLYVRMSFSLLSSQSWKR